MSSDPATTRRTLLKTACAVGVGGLLAGCVGSATDAESTTTSEPAATDASTPAATTRAEESDQTTAETVAVLVGPDGDNVFAPDALTVPPGTTVEFDWDSEAHNVVPTSQPEDADWQGHEALEGGGFEYEYTFETPGDYHYECAPHTTLGMTGVIRVREGADAETSAPPTDDSSTDGTTQEPRTPVETDRIEIGGDENDFSPGTDRPVRVAAGDEVTFVWAADSHNVVPISQPDGADWQGHEDIEDEGFEATFIFDVPGTYEFACQPHRALGATGTLVVEANA